MGPVDATVRGMALETFGLTSDNTISGLGLVTFGFLWGCPDIWGPADDPVSTTWTNVVDGTQTVETCL